MRAAFWQRPSSRQPSSRQPGRLVEGLCQGPVRGLWVCCPEHAAHTKAEGFARHARARPLSSATLANQASQADPERSALELFVRLARSRAHRDRSLPRAALVLPSRGGGSVQVAASSPGVVWFWSGCFIGSAAGPPGVRLHLCISSVYIYSRARFFIPKN